MSVYYCSECQQDVERESLLQNLKSYCSTTGQDVILRRVK